MIYIFEGCDGSGKSTQAKLFSEVVDLPIIGNPYPRYFLTHESFKKVAARNLIEACTKMHWEQWFNSGFSFICDRALISSIVYTRFERRSFDFQYIYDLFNKMNDNIMIFYFYRGLKNLREDDIFNPNHMEKIHEIYKEVIEELSDKITIATFDVDAFSIEGLAIKLQSFI